MVRDPSDRLPSLDGIGYCLLNSADAPLIRFRAAGHVYVYVYVYLWQQAAAQRAQRRPRSRSRTSILQKAA